MATSAFKSSSRRSSIAPGDAGSSNRAAGAHRRSRSLSRYSGRFPPPPPETEDFTTPRGKFVNKTRGSERGSEFPEISLDDLADDFFGTKGFEVEEDEIRSGLVRSGRSSRRSDDERFRMETESSRRRGRSVSKKGSLGNCDGSRQQRRSVSVARRRSDGLEDKINCELRCHDRVAGERNGLNGNDRNSRLRRSVSVARYPCSDLEDKINGKLRCHDRVAGERNGLYGNDCSSRPRRSVSVARYQCSDLESDTDKSYDSNKLRSFDNGNFQQSFSKNKTSTFHVLRRSMSQKDLVQSLDNYLSDTDKSYDSNKLRSFDNGNFQQSFSKNKTSTSHVLRRSMSQKDLVQSLDNYSSHSSSLTDDEAWDIHSNKTGPEKTFKAIYTLEKPEHPTGDGDGSGFYKAMRNEVRHAVYEIRTGLEKVMGKTEPTTLANGDVNQPKDSNTFNIIAEIRRNCTNKLEESEKRKQELLAKLAAEEQRGQELTDIVRKLLPAPKHAAAAERPSRSRRRSNDRTRMSKCLTEEAERYFEDFLSNVEDTDISSFDGEKSDTSSTLGGSVKLREPAVHNAISEAHAILAKATSLPEETDGVLLPWLEWETSNDVTPPLCKSKAGVPWTAAQEANGVCDNTTRLSSLASWSPEGNDSSPAVSSGAIGNGSSAVGSHLMRSSCFSAAGLATRSPFDMDEYLELQRSEEHLFEKFKRRQRIESGGLILCGRAP